MEPLRPALEETGTTAELVVGSEMDATAGGALQISGQAEGSEAGGKWLSRITVSPEQRDIEELLSERSPLVSPGAF